MRIHPSIGGSDDRLRRSELDKLQCGKITKKKRLMQLISDINFVEANISSVTMLQTNLVLKIFKPLPRLLEMMSPRPLSPHLLSIQA